MWDGFKIPLDAALCERLKSDKTAKLRGTHDLHTKEPFHEVKGKMYSLFVDMESPYSGEIRGSLQMFWNQIKCGTATNWGQFTYTEFCNAAELLCDILDREPHQIELSNLEAGYNLLNPPFPAKEIIKRGLMMGGQHFHRWKGNTGLEINRTHYRAKMYDKATIARLRFVDILRWELAASKMQFWQDQGIKTLADLLEIGTWQAVHEKLIEYLKSIVTTSSFAPQNYAV